MAEYIEREAALAALCRGCDKMVPSDEREHCRYRFAGCMEYYNIFELAAADVRPVVRGKNLGKDYNEVDQFVCSECGVELQEWVRVERDEDFGEVTYHEQYLNFCPICGADVREAKA